MRHVARTAFWNYAMACLPEGIDHDEVVRLTGLLSVLNPLIAQADTGLPPLRPIESFDAASYAMVMAKAAKFYDHHAIELVPHAEADMKLGLQAGFTATLEPALAACWSGVLDAAEKANPGFLRHYHLAVGRYVVAFLVGSYRDAFASCSDETYQEVVLGYAKAPVYYLAAVATDNATAIRALAPFMRKLAQGVPIGELREKPGTWYVLCG